MASKLLFILYCLEAGIFFILAPWTGFWTTNPMFQSHQLLAMITESFWFRGSISGFGLIHLLIGSREALMMLTGRRERGAAGEEEL